MPTDIEKITSRRNQILALAAKYNYEQEHSQHVMMLALKLFDCLRPLHGLTDANREWLEYAAILHDIGWIEGQKAHHKTALRFIVASDIPLFSPEERIYIGLIARYHRKSLPKDKHDFFKDLNKEMKQTICVLASFLRLADGLDRTHSSCIEDFTCEISSTTIVLKITKSQGFSETDKALGMKKSDLLKLVFNREFVIDWK